jgi:succinate-semialdehyde dehydrogenase/glutarate-semialdehyde dehydrogenase
MEAMRVGDPMSDATDIGPLATAKAVDELEEQVNAAIMAGATVLTGGERRPGEGNYFEPTVLADVPRSAPVYRDEMFGPVAMLFRALDLEEAIKIANDTPFGLAASAWTRDPGEQQRLVRELAAGSVFLNKMVASDPRLPFGGIKHSGYGRELSAAGMREFMNAKTVVIA